MLGGDVFTALHEPGETCSVVQIVVVATRIAREKSPSKTTPDMRGE